MMAEAMRMSVDLSDRLIPAAGMRDNPPFMRE